MGTTLEEVRSAVEGSTISTTSPHSITVPGAVSGWFALHHRFGTVPMTRLPSPAIDYAREGAPVPHYIATLWALPPNSQGIAALQMLRLLDPFDLASMGHNSAAYLHHLIEAKKIAFEDVGRIYADPAT